MKRILILIVFLVPSLLFAQDSDLGNWMIYFGNKKLNSKWNLHHEVQYRNYNAIGDLEQLLLRAGVGYNLTEGNNNLLLGYGFINSKNYIPLLEEKVSFNEHRVYQQFITKHKIARVSVQHRYRFEQRWVASQDMKVRFRYFLSINVPISNNKMTDNTWYASAYNEIFVNGKQPAFDRNRLYGGIGYKLNKGAKFELGYMNQYFNIGGRDQINLITFLSF